MADAIFGDRASPFEPAAKTDVATPTSMLDMQVNRAKSTSLLSATPAYSIAQDTQIIRGAINDFAP